jgi:hypothetical protein
MRGEWRETHDIGAIPATDADRRVAMLAARQWGVVSLADLYACGLTYRQVQVRVARGQLHPLYRGVFAVGHHNISLEGHFLAATKACGPDAVLSRFSAAVLWELVTWDGRPFEVTAPTRHEHPRIKAHRSKSIELVTLKGIPVTPKLRTVIDLARVEEERVVTRALRQARFNAEELAQLPRSVLDLGAVATRSPVEDSAYDVVVRGGLRAPAEVNVPYRLARRTVVPDLRWPELRLIVEVDSRAWHDDPLAQLADQDRQAELEALGERVIRVRKAELHRPARFLARLRAAGVPEG